jgi:hypothetical protein
MASCTLPITTSPGKLVIMYSQITKGHEHRISWHFIHGVNLTDIPDLRTEAERLADLMGEALTAAFRVTGWAVATPDGSIFYEEPFPAPIPGTLPPAAGTADYASTTIAFVGVGLAPAPGVCHGRSISRLFMGASYPMTPGTKNYLATGTAELQAFIVTGLNASTYVPADVYGQQADILSVCPIQFNAAAQRKWGC